METILLWLMSNNQGSSDFPNSSLIQYRKTYADLESSLQSARYVEYRTICEIQTEC